MDPWPQCPIVKGSNILLCYNIGAVHRACEFWDKKLGISGVVLLNYCYSPADFDT